MTEIGIGVLGFGFIGKIHARAAVNTAGANLAGVWTQADSTLDDLKETYGESKVFASPDDLINSPKVQAVVIGLPNSLHYSMAMKAFGAGKHVLVEKPMAMSVAEAEEMASAARLANVRLMVGHMWRFDSEVNAVKQLVDTDKIGKIIKTKSYGIHQNWGPAGWFTSKKLAGGGALIDMGVHALDTTRYLLGDPDPVSVTAVVERHFGDYDVDDLGILMIRWSNQATSIIESGWWNPYMDGPEASTQLFGTKGYARVFPTVAQFTSGEDPWLPRFPVRSDHCEQPMYDRQMGEFISAVAEKREPVPGSKEGLAIMKICEAAYKSSEVGETIRLK